MDIENEKWIDLDGTKKVWLKLTFDEFDIFPITSIDFLLWPCHN